MPHAPVREPELLTHRDSSLDFGLDGMPEDDPDGFDDDDDEQAEGGEAELSPEESRRLRRKKIFRRVRRTLYVLIALGFLAPVVAFFVVYQFVDVPDPNKLVAMLNQPITLYYADGSPMFTKTGEGGNHQLVGWDQIPAPAKNAVMAAEDETFMTNPGFDLKAIMRTVYNQLTGGTGGGSTITQEYIKKATGNDQHSLTRKFTEMVEAYKMNNTYSKQDILTAYLNTVYFGRGAYGIAAAAKAYYGEDISKLTNEQAALLAGLIQLPGYANDAAYQHKRYNYVMDRMQANHWVTDAERQSAQFPAPLDQNQADQSTPLAKDRQYIVTEALKELDQAGYSDEQLSRNGAKIYTTIDPKAEAQAEDSVTKIMSADARYPDEAAALVSADPRTGNIIAYYGGDGSTAYDLAMTPQQPGSSFKPYVFAAGLVNDPKEIGLDTLYDGSDNQTIDGQVVHNSDGEGAKQMTVKDAMTQSVNTVFYRMAAQIGVTKVRQTAWDLGIPKQITASLNNYTFDSLQQDDPATGKGTGETQLGISIGQYPVRPIDQAQGYATFANNGMYLPLHFVTKVTDNSGSMLYQFTGSAKPAFSSDPTTNAQIARTVTESMSDVATSSRLGLQNNRPNGAKTGTAQFNKTGHNSEAWMVGFTPQVVTSVWFGNKKQPAPIYGDYHNGVGKEKGYDVYGREEPGYIWQAYMNAYLSGKPVEKFPNVDTIGGDANFSGAPVSSSDSAPPPSKSEQQQPPTITETPTPSQEQTPTETPSTEATRPCGILSCTTTSGGKKPRPTDSTANPVNPT